MEENIYTYILYEYTLYIYIYLGCLLAMRDGIHYYFPNPNYVYTSLRNCNATLWKTRAILKNCFWGAVDVVVNAADV